MSVTNELPECPLGVREYCKNRECYSGTAAYGLCSFRKRTEEGLFQCPNFEEIKWVGIQDNDNAPELFPDEF